MTHGEVRQRNVDAMGVKCGELYTDLWNEILWLHATWRQYRGLFGKSKERIDLINETAAFFFRIVEDALWHDVLLQITRLTDPPNMGKGRDNLTILSLPDTVGDQALAKKIQGIVHRAVAAAAFARDWRNRRIAHRDLAILRGPAKPLAPASRASVETVLAELRAIVQTFEEHFFRAEFAFDLAQSAEADALVYHLSMSRMIHEERLERLRAGVDRPEEHKRPPEI